MYFEPQCTTMLYKSCHQKPFASFIITIIYLRFFCLHICVFPFLFHNLNSLSSHPLRFCCLPQLKLQIQNPIIDSFYSYQKQKINLSNVTFKLSDPFLPCMWYQQTLSLFVFTPDFMYTKVTINQNKIWGYFMYVLKVKCVLGSS